MLDPVVEQVVDRLLRIEQGAWFDRLAAASSTEHQPAVHAWTLATLRWALAADAKLESHSNRALSKLDRPMLAAMRLALVRVLVLEHPVGPVVDQAVRVMTKRLGRRRSGFVNAVLRRALESTEGLDAARSIPGWLASRWSARWGKAGLQAICSAINNQAQPYAVVRGPSESPLSSLREAGVQAEPDPAMTGGLFVRAGVPQSTAMHRQGEMILVDRASAWVARLAEPTIAGPILDLAAAPGGKATLMSWWFGRPVACSELVASRAKQLGAQMRARTDGVVSVRADSSVRVFAERSASVVLLDAPCSGTGTLRRRPDRRLRLDESGVHGATDKQKRLLEAAAPLVRPGGSLVYSVCSMELEEGELQVRAFLRRYPQFRLQDPRELSPSFGAVVHDDRFPVMSTSPIDGMEGFFAARLVRDEAQAEPLL